MTKILVADDEPDIRRIAAIALRELAGVEILNASSGEEALAVAREQVPDLVLLDVMMSGLDGLSALKELKDGPLTRTIPVVVMTARASRADQVRYLAMGAADVVVKPFDPRTLVKRVESLVQEPPDREGEARLRLELDRLRVEFVRGVPARLGRLARLLADTAAATEPDVRRRLRIEATAEAHRLRGTGGSHGLTAFAEVMERLESNLWEASELDLGPLLSWLADARAALPEVELPG